MMSSLFREIGAACSHLLFPRVCEGCRTPLLPEERLLCVDCSLHLPRTGYHIIPDNDTAARLAGRFPFVKATSFAFFVERGLLQHLLHRLKYQNRPEIGVQLGYLFGQELFRTGWCQGMDLLLPVPLHPRKERLRGYNQSLKIAEGISSATGLPIKARALRRIRETASQTRKSRDERLLNVAGAFAPERPGELAGRHLVIVDDVLTTGATLETCANALLQLPDTRVSLLTLALATG